MRLLVGGCADFLRELIDFGHHVGNLAQRGIQFLAQIQAFVHYVGAAVHVLDRLACLFLNALDQLGNLLGRLRRLFRQLANLISHDGEAQAVLARARRFDGRIKGQQIGLFCQVVNYLDNLANVIGARAQCVDNLARGLNGGVDLVQAVGSFLHRANAALYLFARAVGDVEQNFGSVRHALNGRHHLINRSGSLTYAGSLHLGALHHVLHVHAHLMHGAGNFIDSRRSLQANLGRLIGRPRDLVRGARDL